jgi:hypothetical protein
MTARFFTLTLLVLLGACTDSARQPPGVAADTDSQNKKPARVELSHASGFHEQPIAVRLTHPDPAATIYYTLDGSNPDPANTAGSTYQFKNLYSYRRSDPFGPFLENRYQTHRYHQPIQVADRSSEPDRYSRINTTILSGLPRYFPAEIPLSNAKQKANGWIAGLNKSIARFNGCWTDMTGGASPWVSQVPLFQPPAPRHLLKGTVIRAVAFKNGQALGNATTASYFIMPRTTFKLPVVSLVAPEEPLFGHDKGILVAGSTHDNFRKDNPDQQRAMGNAPANWGKRGVEVPAHFHFFSDEVQPDQASVDQGVGIRVHGGVNRAAPSKALRIYARKEYGKSTLKHAFFGDEQKYKRLLLRNSGNDFYSTYLRDAVVQQIMAGLKFDTQAYRPTVVFLNGEYWGLLNMREYYNKHYLARVYQVDEDRLDIMDLDKADEGDDKHWRNLMAYIETHSLQEERHFAHVASQIDIDNFVDYHIANIFAANYDWPHNNVRHWRARIDGAAPDAPAGQDGRWRWLMFDMDDGFKRVHGTALHRLATNGDTNALRGKAWSAFLFRSLMQNEAFRERFISRFADTLNTTFVPERMTAIVEATSARVAPEMPRHIDRWKTPEDMAFWSKGVDQLLLFAKERTAIQRKQLVRHFRLGEPIRLSVDVSDSAHGSVRVNSLTLDEDLAGVQGPTFPWTGHYFRQVPIELEALPNACFAFSHWEGDSRSSQRIVLRAAGDVSVRAVFSKTCDAG